MPTPLKYSDSGEKGAAKQSQDRLQNEWRVYLKSQKDPWFRVGEPELKTQAKILQSWES